MSRQFAVDTKGSETHSRPIPLWLPEEYKAADINEAQGRITAYLSVYSWPDGKEYRDAYSDVVQAGAFKKTCNDLNQARKARNYPYLCPFLWNHERKELLGGIVELYEDSKGTIYEAQLDLNVQRAREAFSLASKRMTSSSFGYDAVRFYHKGDVRYLTELKLYEGSLTPFPANDLATIIDTKDNKKVYVPSNYSISQKQNLDFPDVSNLPQPEIPPVIFPDVPDIVDEQTLSIKAVCGSTTLHIGPRDEQWDYIEAKKQYKEWGMDSDGHVAPDKWKQVHLFVDGSPYNPASYSYPYCYIFNGVPRICVDAVKQLVKQLKTLKTPEKTAMRQKCVAMLERINQKYARDPIVLNQNGIEFDYKQDFSSAWTRKQPGQLLQEFFRMSDTLAYVLLNNIDDEDVQDKAGSVDTCCNQFSASVKDWLPEYTSAKEASDALSDDDSSEMMPMYGVYGLDMAGISVKHVIDVLHEETDIKAGRTLSDKTKKKLRTALDNIHTYLTELSDFVEGKTDEEPEPPKAEPEAPTTFDITQDLESLGTLTPIKHTSSTSPQNQQTAPISFPKVEQEYDLSDLLQSIQFNMRKTG